MPELSLVVLVGPSGCGKSTFAGKHFKSTEVLSSDYCRSLVSDDENDQSATTDAFAALHFIAGRRLARGKLTVVDATNVQAEARKPLVALAREYHVLPVAIVFDLPERLCEQRNRGRRERDFGPHVIRQQTSQMTRSRSSASRSGMTGRPTTGPSTLSAMFTDVATSSRSCSASWVTPPPPPCGGTRVAGKPCSSATWSTAARGSPTC